MCIGRAFVCAKGEGISLLRVCTSPLIYDGRGSVGASKYVRF